MLKLGYIQVTKQAASFWTFCWDLRGFKTIACILVMFGELDNTFIISHINWCQHSNHIIKNLNTLNPKSIPERYTKKDNSTFALTKTYRLTPSKYYWILEFKFFKGADIGSKAFPPHTIPSIPTQGHTPPPPPYPLKHKKNPHLPTPGQIIWVC